MSLAEGVSRRISYKFYTDPTIDPTSEPDRATDPGATGGQALRNTSFNINLGKDTYSATENASHRQVQSMRHGTKRVTGTLAGELSPGTYFDLYEAVWRGTREATLSATEVDFTSVAADNTASTFTIGGGSWITKGFRVGDTIRFADLSEAGNNSKNFTIVGLTATVATVYPAPTTMAADMAFTVTRPGSKVIIPTSGHVSRKVLFEAYNSDIDVCRLFTECRLGSAVFNMPASGHATTDIGVMGRNMVPLSGASAPFFTSPTAETTTDITAAVGGYLRMNGSTQAVVTGTTVNINLSPTSDPVSGTNLVPEIFLGRSVVTGTVTAFFENADMINAFVNESELELLTRLDASSDANADFITLFMPRVKLNGADLNLQGEGGQTISIPFQALLGNNTSGYDYTTIMLHDSVAA